MSIPPQIVSSARQGWNWQWKQLMNGLAPADNAGNFIRQKSQALNAIPPNPEDLTTRSPESLPILIIGRSCPWAHRTWLIYELRNLQKNLNLVIASPNYKSGRWEINPSLMGCKTLLDIYKLCNSPPSHRATVPTIIDPNPNNQLSPKLLGNESAQLVEAMDVWPAPNNTISFYPKHLHQEINSWHLLLQDSVNNGVYKCGFARNQSAYDKASETLFSALQKIEDCLSDKREWLCGERLSLADVRLFPTIIRWESVYAPLFACSQKKLSTFPNLVSWRKRFFMLPKVSETCNAENWRSDYFGALFPLNPSNIIPKGPTINEIVHNN